MRVVGRLLGWALAVVAVGVPVAAAGDGPSLASFVAFGTTCARCHEGECSGRLTFDLAGDAVTGHVRRHAGAVSDASVPELIGLLERMKKECSYPPLGAPIPPARDWSSEQLERLCIPSKRSYLVPLGRLEPGSYRVQMRLEGAQHVHAEVVTREFEVLLDEPMTIENGAAAVSFRAPAPIEPFLRLQAQDPLWVERLLLKRDEDRP